MSYKILLAVALVLVVGGVGYVVYSNMNASDGPPPVVSGTDTSVPPTPTAPSSDQAAPVVEGQKEFTMADVATHNSRESCYTTVGDNVYDGTDWIAKHPGGEKAILGLCGKDGTAAFTKQHGTFQKAIDALATLKIGVLKK